MSSSALSNEEIRQIIEQLYVTIGLRPTYPLSRWPFDITSSNFSVYAEAILKHMRLPIKLVPDFETAFESTGLTRANSQQGVAAQVLIPSNLPLFTSDSLRGFPVTVRLRITPGMEHSLLTLLTHELCHVFLHSWRHPLKDSEHATDLCALMLGFGDLWDRGRKHTRREQIDQIHYREVTTTHGYLSDENYAFARDYISTRLNPFTLHLNSCAIQIQDVQELCNECSEAISTLFETLDEHRRTNSPVRKGDNDTFSSLCRPGSREALHAEIDEEKRKANALVRTLNSGSSFYTRAYLDQIKTMPRSFRSIIERLTALSKRIADTTKVIERNFKWHVKLRRWFKSLE